jgi:hypothetical protein
MKKFNLFKKCILYVAFIISFLNADARGPRADLNSLTDAQRLELCGLVDNWLTTYLIAFHGDDFDNFHTTNDYLRWHRDHFVDLERYLTEQGKTQYVPFPKWNPANPVPSYFNGFDASGNPYNNISSKCGGGAGCRTREDYVNTNPGYKFNQNGQFNVNLPLPTRFSSSGSLCTFNSSMAWNPSARTFNFSDVADYSDNQQYYYHNSGHSSFDRVAVTGGTPDIDRSLMGNLRPNRASAAYIFWAWHAWIDDMWWGWDACHRQNNGTTVTDAYDIANGLTILSGTTVIWGSGGNIKKIQGKIIIQPGATLIIQSGQIVEMLDDYYTDQDCGFEVQAGSGGSSGGKLIVRTGAILRGITSLGKDKTSGLGADKSVDRASTPNFIYPDAKVYYLSQWPGIVVKGDPTKNARDNAHGQVIIDGYDIATDFVLIQNAKTAITSIDGGIIKCVKAVFRNCSTAVDIKPYLSPSNNDENESSFGLTTFEVTDQITRYFTNDNMYMHYLHDFHEVVHVKLDGVRGIDFAGCIFRNTDPRNTSAYGGTGGHTNARGTGIKSLNSTYALHKDGIPVYDDIKKCISYPGFAKCEFHDLSFGIVASNNAGSTVNTEIGIQDAIFNNNHDGIVFTDGNNIKIYTSAFAYNSATSLFPAGLPASHMHFIQSWKSKQNVIYDNTFTSNEPVSDFIEIVNQFNNYDMTKVQNNTFTSNAVLPPSSTGCIAVKILGDNLNTDIKCNTFSDKFNFCITIPSGALKNQGSSSLSAGNTFPICVGGEMHIQNQSPNNFDYYFKGSAENPNCHTPSTVNTFDISLTPSGKSPREEGGKLCELSCIGYGLSTKSIEGYEYFKIYPNPAHSKFTIELKTPKGVVKLYDVMGKLVLTQKLESLETELDVSKLGKGIYQVVLEQSGTINTGQKLIVD